LSVVDFGLTPLTSGNYFTVASCSGGKIAIGGDVLDETSPPNITINGGGNNGSRLSNTPNGIWNVDFHLATAGTDNVDIQQVCVSPPVGNTAPVKPPAGPAGAKVVGIK
jgi:hypothetical protein